MIKMLPESEGAVIGIAVSGKIDAAEENKWIAVFDDLIEKHGSISVLVVLEGQFNIDLDAAYTDLKWTIKHIKNMAKIAIVSNSKILGWLVAADSPFGKLAGIREKHFDTSDLVKAWCWVKAPVE